MCSNGGRIISATYGAVLSLSQVISSSLSPASSLDGDKSSSLTIWRTRLITFPTESSAIQFKVLKTWYLLRGKHKSLTSNQQTRNCTNSHWKFCILLKLKKKRGTERLGGQRARHLKGKDRKSNFEVDFYVYKMFPVLHSKQNVTRLIYLPSNRVRYRGWRSLFKRLQTSKEKQLIYKQKSQMQY